VADIVFDRGFPGSTNTVTGDFAGLAGDYAVTVNGVAATGVSLPNAQTLQFTMPLIGGISENTTLGMVISKNGAAHVSKTARYRPLLTVSPGQPNGHFPRVNKFDDSVYFTFTAGTHTVSAVLGAVQADYASLAAQGYAQDDASAHIINIFGYNGASLELYSLANATAAFTTLSAAGIADLNFRKANFSGNPIIRVKYASGKNSAGGTTFSFKINVAKGHITAATSSDYYYGTFGLIGCYEFQGGGGGANAASFCATKNPGMTRVGRCTYPSGGGITTRNYYSTGFNQYSSIQTCMIPGNGSYNEKDSIAEDN
jgi:hypothetical protein